MPVPAHHRLTFVGGYGTPSAPIEQWTFGLNLTQPTGPLDAAQRLALANGAHSAWEARLAQHVHPEAFLDVVKHAEIGADGLYASDAVLSTRAPANGSRAIEDQVRYPPQVALAVSLMTNQRGARGRGRFYLGGVAYQVLNDLTLSLVDAESIATTAAGFVQDINDYAGPGNVCVASSSGALHPVTAVRVGRVYDTIRSRRRSIPEEYVTPVPVVPR